MFGKNEGRVLGPERINDGSLIKKIKKMRKERNKQQEKMMDDYF